VITRRMSPIQNDPVNVSASREERGHALASNPLLAVLVARSTVGGGVFATLQLVVAWDAPRVLILITVLVRSVDWQCGSGSLVKGSIGRWEHSLPGWGRWTPERSNWNGMQAQ
jgi:hypothetical protein